MHPGACQLPPSWFAVRAGPPPEPPPAPCCLCGSPICTHLRFPPNPANMQAGLPEAPQSQLGREARYLGSLLSLSAFGACGAWGTLEQSKGKTREELLADARAMSSVSGGEEAQAGGAGREDMEGLKHGEGAPRPLARKDQALRASLRDHSPGKDLRVSPSAGAPLLVTCHTGHCTAALAKAKNSTHRKAPFGPLVLIFRKGVSRRARRFPAL